MAGSIRDWKKNLRQLRRSKCGYGFQRSPMERDLVGVVRGIRHATLGEAPAIEIYLPTQANSFQQFLVVRSSGPVTSGLARSVREAVAGVDPRQPVFLSATMASLIADSVADRRFIMTLLAITGLLGLILAIAGVYGVVSYVTSRRTQEIGVRMALGASPEPGSRTDFPAGYRDGRHRRRDWMPWPRSALGRVIGSRSPGSLSMILS